MISRKREKGPCWQSLVLLKHFLLFAVTNHLTWKLFLLSWTRISMSLLFSLCTYSGGNHIREGALDKAVYCSSFYPRGLKKRLNYKDNRMDLS